MPRNPDLRNWTPPPDPRQEAEPSAPALLPCPFCGTPTAIRVVDLSETGLPRTLYQTGCKPCHIASRLYSTADLAAAWWNRRAANPSLLTAKQGLMAQRHLNELGELVMAFLEADAAWNRIANTPSQETADAYARADEAKRELRRFMDMEEA